MSEQPGVESYQERVKRVRNLPQNTGNERLLKHEQARDLRIETMLSWSAFAREFVDIVANNPSQPFASTKRQLDERKDLLSRPKVADEFIFWFKKNRNQVIGALGYFREQAGLSKTRSPLSEKYWNEYDKNEVGEKVFRALSGEKPTGEVSILITPFALVVQALNGGDFRLIDQRRNVAGFYQSSKYLDLKTRHLVLPDRKYTIRDLYFPLVVVSSRDTNLLRHELGHGVNKMIMRSLGPWSPQFRNVWGGRHSSPGPGPVGDVIELSNLLSGPAYGYSLARAKDELVTDFAASGNFDHLSHLVDSSGLYNYFEHVLKAYQEEGGLDIQRNRVDSVKKVIWLRYTEELRMAVRSAEDLRRSYQGFGLKKRLELLPYILAQVPLSRWSTGGLKDLQGEVSSFHETFKEALRASRSYNRRSDFKVGNGPFDRLGLAVLYYDREFREVSTGSIFGITRRLKASLNYFYQEVNAGR